MWPIIAALSVIVIDQATKYLVLQAFTEGHTTQIIPGFFNLTLVFNPGAAFGLFPNFKYFFLIFATVAIIIIFFVAYTYARNNIVLQMFLGLVVGGACGNLIDRIRIGHVVDFLDFYISSYHWPSFNIADSAICIGMGVLTYMLIKYPQVQ